MSFLSKIHAKYSLIEADALADLKESYRQEMKEAEGDYSEERGYAKKATDRFRDTTAVANKYKPLFKKLGIDLKHDPNGGSIYAPIFNPKNEVTLTEFKKKIKSWGYTAKVKTRRGSLMAPRRIVTVYNSDGKDCRVNRDLQSKELSEYLKDFYASHTKLVDKGNTIWFW